jgi:hypothetical protein
MFARETDRSSRLRELQRVICNVEGLEGAEQVGGQVKVSRSASSAKTDEEDRRPTDSG